MVKLELGAGTRPTPGYIATDIFPHDDVTQASAHTIDYPDESLDEVLALGVIEHLTFAQARTTFANMHRMLKVGGVFLFDVPNLPVWCGYLIAHANGKPAPFPLDHVLSTLYGWQRWQGDEHKSGWTQAMLDEDLKMFAEVSYGVDEFLYRGHDRRRMHRPEDAHLYVRAVR